MAPRKRHSKTQFVIPEEVQVAAGSSGWTYKTEPAPTAKPAAPLMLPPTPRASVNPVESGVRAFTYSVYAFSEMLVFTMGMIAMPVAIAGRMFRR